MSATPRMIGPELATRLDWSRLIAALRAGHLLPKAQIADSFLYREADTLLTRSAWIDGLGLAIKAATIFPDNPAQGHERVNGGMVLLDDAHGQIEAVVDFHMLTRWKTAGDSLLAASILAPPKVERALVIGAGQVAGSMVEAYRALWPNAEIQIWARRPEAAAALAARMGAAPVTDLPAAVARAQLIATTTMATQPVLHGAWLSPGTHVDLIGAYRPDMREADDEALRRARIFVDSRDSTLGHIGEIQAPIDAGVITQDDLVADFYDIAAGRFARLNDDEITICKNGGGAHLDLMVARYMLDEATRDE